MTHKESTKKYFKKHWHFFSLSICVFLSIIFYTALCWSRHLALFNYEYIDIAEILNISWNTAQGKFFYQTIVPNEYEIFVFHFEPIILLIALFFRVFDHPISLYIAFNTLLACAVYPFFLFSKKILDNKVLALFLSLAYLLYAPLKGMYILSDPDPILLTIPFIFCAFYFYENKKFALCALSAIFIMLCKENAALTVACLGLYIWGIKKNTRFGLMLFIGGISYAFLTIKVIETSGIYDGQSLYCFLKYNSFLGNLKFIIFRPIAFFTHVIDNKHIDLLGNLLKHFFYIPLLTPEFFISLPSIMQVFLSKRPIEMGRLYYAAQTVPFMFIGLTYFLKRIKDISRGSPRFKNKVITTITFLVLITCIFSNFSNNMYGYLRKDRLTDSKYAGITNIYDRRFYTRSERDEYIWKIVSMIPRDAPVMVSANVAAIVADRETIYYFPYPHADTSILLTEGCDVDKFLSLLEKVNYLLIDTQYRGYGAGEYPYLKKEDLKNLLTRVLKDKEWTYIKDDYDIIFLKRLKTK